MEARTNALGTGRAWRAAWAGAAVAVLSASLCRASEPPPVLSILDRFTAPSVPAAGPDEVAVTRSWLGALVTPPALPGKGIAEHPMLYAGEGLNTLFLVNKGSVIWTYSIGSKGEIGDAWLLSNGHILFSRMLGLTEVNPDKQVVWKFDAPAGTEIYTCQPIGLDRVLLVENGLPPRLMIVNKETGGAESAHDLPCLSLTDRKVVHAEFRRVRMTGTGTFLVPFLTMNQVVEYDKNFLPIWTYAIRSPWDAHRLKNGDTLITDENDKLVREVNPAGATVWEFTQADLPPSIVLHNIQTCERLDNGDSVIFSSTAGTRKQNRSTIVQCVEVTPDKKLVWVLQDWADLGPATTAQFLDQAGVPERPGDLRH